MSRSHTPRTVASSVLRCFMAEPARPSAFETDDGALRCYLDQLPPDRCVFCATATPTRLLRVAGPVHHASGYEDMADGGAGKRLLHGVGVLAGRPVAHQALQTKGRAWLAVCPACTPKPMIPLLIGVVVTASTALYAVLHGFDAILQTVTGTLLAIACFVLWNHRRTLRVGEIDEDDHMFKLRGVAPEIVTTVLALGPTPHPEYQARSNQLT